MGIIERAYSLLTETERTVASLASEASASRNYDQAASLIGLARQINELAERFLHSSSHRDVPVDSRGQARNENLAKEPSASTMKRSKPGQYPRFLREDDSLVKVGWSKSEKAEYEHKSPKRVLTVLCEALAAANGKRVTMDKVLPLKDNATGSSFPDYQSYVCLAWLKSAGLVLQHGRKGYSLSRRIDLQKSAEVQWASLPSR